MKAVRGGCQRLEIIVNEHLCRITLVRIAITRIKFLLPLISFFMSTGTVALAGVSSGGRTIILRNNWIIQSSEAVRKGGKVISANNFRPRGWYRASVPSTILGSLVSNGVFENPFQGLDLEGIPDSLFVEPWRYRTTFELPAEAKNASHVTLKFLGVNYKAEVWLNGRLIASSDSVLGGFRMAYMSVKSRPQNHLLRDPDLTKGVISKSGEFTVLPTFWDDNYISFLPRGIRSITGYFDAQDLKGGSPQFEVSGWNVEKRKY